MTREQLVALGGAASVILAVAGCGSAAVAAPPTTATSCSPWVPNSTDLPPCGTAPGGPAVGDPCDHARFNAVTTSNNGTTVRCYGVMDPMWYRWEPDVGPIPNPHDVGNGMDY